MSKLTTFQELRHKCAKLYCPREWNIGLWANFFGDCFKLHALNEVDRKQSADEISKCYNIHIDIVTATVQFQKDNGLVED